MAGRIALGIAVGVLLFLFGYSVHRETVRSTELPFKVKRVVNVSDQDAITIDGMTGPFTVLIYEGPTIQRTVPGVIGRRGDEIWMTPPGDR
jgi:hypothetical protein